MTAIARAYLGGVYLSRHNTDRLLVVESVGRGTYRAVQDGQNRLITEWELSVLYVLEPDKQVCRACNGDGHVWADAYEESYGGHYQTRIVCLRCRGRGYVRRLP